MTLHPSETTQKALISTTSRLVGEYEKSGALITHAWPSSSDPSMPNRMMEGPTSRSAYMFVFNTEPTDKKTVIIPNYSPMGELICSYLAVLFGKRFDSHGLLESNGFFNIPDLTQFGQFCNQHLPQNSHAERVDFPVPLNLVEFSRIERLLLDETIDSKFLSTFQGASKFYLLALQNAEHNPEVAYLHLITAGEILSNFYTYKKDQLLDDETKKVLTRIRSELSDGKKAARFISGKLLQVKRRFVKTILQYIDSDFFQRSESREPSGGFKEASFECAVSAAYDLRSKYVHTGIPFGNWVSQSFGPQRCEMIWGNPVVEDKDLGKILAKAPTYLGLERVIRYCLLCFAQSNGAYVEPSVESADHA